MGPLTSGFFIVAGGLQANGARAFPPPGCTHGQREEPG